MEKPEWGLPGQIITHESDNHGKYRFQYIDTINVHKYDVGARYKNFTQSIKVESLAPEEPNSPWVHLYVPTTDVNSEDLPIASMSQEEAYNKLQSLKIEEQEDEINIF